MLMSRHISGPTSTNITANGVRLHYLEWGSAANPAVVLLHGLSSNSHNWDFLCQALADDYHLFAIDQRGHGDSGRPASGYHSSDYAADLAAFRDALGLSSIFLIGHSMGGRVSVFHTAHGQQRVDRLALIDSGPDANPAGLQRVRQALEDAPESFADEAEAYAHIQKLRPRYSDETLRNRVRHALRRRDDGRLIWKYDKAALLQTTQGTPGVDWWDCLAKVSCPTLIVRGAASDIFRRETARRMLEVIPQSELYEIPEATHAVPYEDTTLFEAAIRRFFAAPV